jgi:hypothetical protein
MKLFASLLLAVMLLFTPTVKAQVPQPDFRDTLSKATLAVYHGKQMCEYKNEDFEFFGFLVENKVWECSFKSEFKCTATVIAGMDNEYAGLTAGHCIKWDQKDEYYISDDVSEHPVLRKIEIAKFDNSDRYDYAIFRFKSLRNYPAIQVQEDGPIPSIGTKVLNVNFSFGITKQIVEGPIVSGIIENTNEPAQRRRFLVQLSVGPGASGSALVDETTHKIVGLAERIFPGTQMAIVAIPTGSNFIDFLDDASAGLKPLATPEPKHEPTEAERAIENQKKFLGYVSIACFSLAGLALIGLGIILRARIKVLFVRIIQKFQKKK